MVIALVVSVIASFVVGKITGNAITAPSSSSELKISGNGMLDPRLSFDNKQLGGAAIKFNEQGVYKAGISGGSFGASSSIIQLDADAVSVKGLKGTENAYACIDKNGKIYRSVTACK